MVTKDRIQEWLIGSWESDPDDADGRQALGDTVLDFRRDGTLIHTFRTPEKDQVAILEYWIDGEHIVTDQKSAPTVQRTRFELIDGGRLLLEHDGRRVYYVRLDHPPERCRRNGANHIEEER
jgi:hypothetical protein